MKEVYKEIALDKDEMGLLVGILNSEINRIENKVEDGDLSFIQVRNCIEQYDKVKALRKLIVYNGSK